jgi:aspartate racemase
MHIGLIGGIGPAATEFYYRGLVRNCTAASSGLELTIAHADMNVLLRNMTADAPDEQARVFRHHVEQLAGAGATIAAVTSIAGHFCFRELEAISPLPLVSALTTLGLEIERRGLRRVGLLGSQIAVESKLYGSLTGVEIVLPKGDDMSSVSEEYIAMARSQCATESQRELFFSVGARLCSEQDAEVVILAGTDMFLAFAGAKPGFEVIDCAEVHIQALAELAQKSATLMPG